ncbi:MAG: hypothetical protein EXQ60_08140 [Candidatus Nanopelagicales bacterium]|nr:hypothetical protein [Candidatus Nanopelagicales bacterium]
MTLVAGVDSSTQSVKVVIRDADPGAWVREARAPHPEGTGVDPGNLRGCTYRPLRVACPNNPM